MILVGMGSNLPGFAGSPVETVRSSLSVMNSRGLKVLSCSDLYETPPVGPPGQANYVNAVVRVAGVLSPHGLLDRLRAVEDLFGRQRTVKWGARTLDLDLLDWHGQRINGRLNLPHPGLSGRGFVLRPLIDVAPEWRHPETGRSAAVLWRRLPVAERLKIVKL